MLSRAVAVGGCWCVVAVGICRDGGNHCMKLVTIRLHAGSTAGSWEKVALYEKVLFFPMSVMHVMLHEYAELELN